MTTQKKAIAVVNSGGKIQNGILLDADGYPRGNLTDKQLTALLDKGLRKTVKWDGTEVIW